MTLLRRLLFKEKIVRHETRRDVSSQSPATLPLDAFREWLTRHALQDAYSARELRSYYAEFCEVTGTTGLTDGQLFR
jgi:hypothetical protein